MPIRHTALEKELTVGSGIRCVSGKQFGDGTDVGYNRMNFRWGNVGTFQISPGSHMWQVVSEAYRRNEKVPLTFCFGVPPACTLLAGAAFDYVILPYGCDELGVAGAAQGFPVRVVKARTVDAWAIADSEMVIEGYVDPRDRRFETAESEADQTQGKHHFHPEWAGYMGKAYKAPTFHVTAITMRKEAKRIIYCLGAHTLDEHNIDTSIREAAMFELCHRLQPGIIQDVNIPYCMTDWGGVIIQVKKRNRLEEGWQRNFLTTLLATSQGMRVAIAVSEDTDIYSMDEIMWAITTRVNPQTDILNPTPGGRGQTFMPAERMTAGDREWTATNTRYEGGMGIDATVPYGYEEDFMRPVYPVDRVKLEDFFTKDQIANVTGPSERAGRSCWQRAGAEPGSQGRSGMAGVFGDHQLGIPYQPIAELLAKYKARDPKKTAIVDLDSGSSITFGELDQITTDIGVYLKGRGITKGSRVLLLSDENLEKLLIWLGVWRIGAVICPFNIEINEKQMVALTRRSIRR